MRYDLTSQQFVHFQKNRKIILEDILLEKEQQALLDAPYKKDLFRENSILYNLTTSRKTGSLIKELTEKSLMRLLFDQKFAAGQTFNFSAINTTNLLMACIVSLEDFSFMCIDPIGSFSFKEDSYLILYTEHPLIYLFSESGNDFFKEWKQQKRYNYGDRLKIEDFPFIHG